MTVEQCGKGPLQWVWQTIRATLVVALALAVVACGGGGAAPTGEVIEQAVVQQFEATQQALQQQLALGDATAANLHVSNVKAKHTQRVVLQEQPVYRVEGTYTLAGKLLSRSVRQPRNPFEIYLQSQDGGQTWTLVEPGSGA